MTPPDSPDLSPDLVCAAYSLCSRTPSLADLVASDHKEGSVAFPHEVLAAWTGQSLAACRESLDVAAQQGLIESDPPLCTGRLTKKGAELLEQSCLNPLELCVPTIRRQNADLEAAMFNAINSMSPEAQRLLAEDLAKQGDALPRPPRGLHH